MGCMMSSHSGSSWGHRGVQRVGGWVRGSFSSSEAFLIKVFYLLFLNCRVAYTLHIAHPFCSEYISLYKRAFTPRDAASNAEALRVILGRELARYRYLSSLRGETLGT